MLKDNNGLLEEEVGGCWRRLSLVDELIMTLFWCGICFNTPCCSCCSGLPCKSLFINPFFCSFCPCPCPCCPCCPFIYTLFLSSFVTCTTGSSSSCSICTPPFIYTLLVLLFLFFSLTLTLCDGLVILDSVAASYVC